MIAMDVKRRRIHLVRHGHVNYFDADGKPLDPRHVSLSAQGVMQAQSLAAVLRDVRFDRILCSDLERARETAAIVAGASDTAIEAQAALREIRLGRLREIPHDRLEADLAYAYDHAADDGACFVGGESFAEFERRILDVLENVLLDDAWENLLIVSHDAVNRIMLCWASGSDRRAMAAFEQDMCCMNIVDVDMVDGKPVRRLIRCMNYTPYDALKSESRLTVMEKVFHSYRVGGR